MKCCSKCGSDNLIKSVMFPGYWRCINCMSTIKMLDKRKHKKLKAPKPENVNRICMIAIDYTSESGNNNGNFEKTILDYEQEERKFHNGWRRNCGQKPRRHNLRRWYGVSLKHYELAPVFDSSELVREWWDAYFPPCQYDGFACDICNACSSSDRF